MRRAPSAAKNSQPPVPKQHPPPVPKQHPPPVPKHDMCEPSAAKSVRSDLPWVLLDRYVHRKGDGVELVEDGLLDGTQSKKSYTCTGLPVAVSLRVAEPPAVSRLYFHWIEGFKEELSQLDGPSVIAADGQSILLQAHVPLVKERRPTYYYPIDYFVYTASRSEKSPSLRRLPACFEGGKEPEVDPHFVPYRLQHQRVMDSQDIGFLCRGDEEFIVAHLTYFGDFCMLHRVPGGEKATWSFDTLPMSRHEEEGAPNLLRGSWQTDTVIPFRDCYLCWVDYYLGLLFVGVLGKLTKVTRYVPLPEGLDPRRLYIDPGCPDPARRVCVTDTGMIKLVCVSDRAGCSVHKSYCSDFIIRVWTLADFAKGEWKEDASMEASEFWADLDFKGLPHVLPEFPTMSLAHHDVICFLLNDSNRVCWLVEVNIKDKVLGAVTLYVHEEEEEGFPADMALRMSIPCHSFVPSQLTQYLDKDAIKSFEFSEKLQKAKLQRTWIKK